MFTTGDIVICKDTSGFSTLEIEVGNEYVVESVLDMCYIRLVGVKQSQKMWRFHKKSNSALTKQIQNLKEK